MMKHADPGFAVENEGIEFEGRQQAVDLPAEFVRHICRAAGRSDHSTVSAGIMGTVKPASSGSRSPSFR